MIKFNLANSYNLKIVEDCAQAHGAQILIQNGVQLVVLETYLHGAFVKIR